MCAIKFRFICAIHPQLRNGSVWVHLYQSAGRTLLMIIIVEAHNARKHAHLLEQMFRMRARIFHDRLGWDVTVKDGKERDRYDDENPVYIIYTDDRGEKVKG